MISSIDELTAYLDSFYPSLSNPEIRFNRLERMERLLDRLGHPEREYRTYHIAGSKGKGSTACFLAALLEGAGRCAGLYTSPHLFSIKERFQLPFSFFEDSFYIDVANILKEAVNGFELPPRLGTALPTTFELYTAYGYLLFKEYGCTDAVIETGMGGRLDATNTLQPEAVLLTPIELEHTEVLGSDIASISKEKSKIIQEGVPVFVSLQTHQEALSVFKEEAARLNAPLYLLSSALDRLSFSGISMSAVISGMEYNIKLSMPTLAMAENAALSLYTADKLSFLTENGLKLLSRARLPGRFERLSIEGRDVVVDVAHTVQSARSARETFKSFSRHPSCLIFSCIEGKDSEGMLNELVPLFDHVIISSAGSFKRNNPDKLFNIASALFPDKPVYLEKNPDNALELALSLAESILITGSFYLASEMSGIRRAHESELERA